MAEIIYPFGSSFDPETNRAMGLAFDMAWKKATEDGKRMIGGPHSNAREALALRIISLARQGERDPVTLCDKALSR